MHSMLQGFKEHFEHLFFVRCEEYLITESLSSLFTVHKPDIPCHDE